MPGLSANLTRWSGQSQDSLYLLMSPLCRHTCTLLMFLSLVSAANDTVDIFLVFLISRTFRQIYISLLSFANSCSNDRLLRIPYAILYFANCTKRLQPPGHAWFRGCTFLCVRSAFPSILTHQFICQLSGGTVMPLISWNVQEHGLFLGIWCPARYQVKLDGRR